MKTRTLTAALCCLALTIPAPGAVTKISDYTSATSLASGDFFPMVDISDNTMAVTGTTKKVTFSVLSDYLASVAETLENKTITSPTITVPSITGGTVIELTSLSIRSNASLYDLNFVNSETLTGDRNLTFKVNNASRTVDLGGNLTIASSFTTSGAYALTFTVTASTNVTLPTTGTLATLAGMETLTGKTLNMTGNTLTGTKAQFNTALSDDDFAYIGADNTFTGANTFSNTTASTGTGTGALIISGGIGAAKDSYFSTVRVGRGGSSTQSTSSVGVGTGTVLSNNSSTGNENAAFGDSALSANGNGDRNTGIGASAFLSLSSASANNNTGIGAYAGSNFTTGSGNTILGYSCANQIGDGATSFTTGTNNTYVGSSVYPLTDSATHEIIIGSNATGMGSNTATMGRIQTTRTQIYGAGVNRGHIAGLTLSNNASDATNDIDIADGEARDTTNVRTMVLSSGLTKRLDAAWQAGTGNGGLDSGTIANATYHVHLIENPNSTPTPTLDVIFSLSHDEQSTVTMTIASPCVVTWGSTGKGHGLVAGSTFQFATTGALPTGVNAGQTYYVLSSGLTETTFQFSATLAGVAVNSSGTQSGVHTCKAMPVLPSGYTYYRRIGSIVRASAAILPFQQDGDEFSLITPVLDVAVTTLGTSRTSYTAASAPYGLRLQVRYNFATSVASGAYIYLSDLATADLAPTVSAASPLASFTSQVSGALGGSGPFMIMVSPNAQFGARSTLANTTFRFATLGWRDTRGRGR